MKTKNPIDLLPIKHPIEYDPSINDPNYFYNNVLRYLIPDIIRISTNGIPINLKKAEELEKVVTNVLDIVDKKLSSNKLMLAFQEYLYPIKFKEYKEKLIDKKRDIDYYLKKGDITNIVHRTYIVNTYLKSINSIHYSNKWKMNDLKKLNYILEDNVLTSIIDKEVDEEIILAGMKVMAEKKLKIYNKSIDTEIDEGTKSKLIPKFNPASSTQKKQLFEFLKLKPIRFSKDTGEPSWNRESLEEYLKTTTNNELKEILQLLIDHSYSAIIKNNFIKAFYNYTIDETLYGNYKLAGTKTMRLTSNSPNLLQLPSTGSIYAKPLKECFKAPKGYVILTADFSQLEDRVIANLSGDENKIAIFTEGLDGHSLASTYYFKEKITKLIGEYGSNHKEASKTLKKLINEGNKEAKAIRQDSKPVTLTYKRLHTVMYVE